MLTDELGGSLPASFPFFGGERGRGRPQVLSTQPPSPGYSRHRGRFLCPLNFARFFPLCLAALLDICWSPISSCNTVALLSLCLPTAVQGARGHSFDRSTSKRGAKSRPGRSSFATPPCPCPSSTDSSATPAQVLPSSLPPPFCPVRTLTVSACSDSSLCPLESVRSLRWGCGSGWRAESMWKERLSQ